MKKIVRLIKIMAISVVLYMPSSCDYLNVEEYFNDMIPLDTIFAKHEYVERYLWGAAALLPAEGKLYGNSYGPYMTAVDEVVISRRGTTFSGTLLQDEQINSFSKDYNFWGQYYKGIRKANTIFTRIDECHDIDNLAKRDILGMTYFLRGSFYYYLLMQYGPIPIVPEDPMLVDGSIEELSFERNTYDECVAYICADMEKAALFLEEKRVSSKFEQPTKYAALSLISRLKLHQASPWFNGNKFYAGWKDSKGQDMIAQTSNEKKWAESAYASQRVINSGLYSLHLVMKDKDTPDLPTNVSVANFPDGAGDIDPLKSYSDMFTGESLAVRNSEIILPTSFNNDNILYAFPLMMAGQNILAVPQVLVDAYRRKDGQEVVYTADDYEKIGSNHLFSGYTLSKDAAKRYLNMEPRFYASIGFCHAYWAGTSVDDASEIPIRTKKFITYYKDGNTKATSTAPDDYNLTGYTIKKYIHEEDNFSSGKRTTKTFSIFRYAEILLNYVEALNELTTSYTFTDDVTAINTTIERNTDEMVKYFNMIRYRAGLPGITIQDAANVETMRDLIKRERMVEFAHEGRRYHDVRRWGIAMETDTKPVRGMDVTQNEKDRAKFYQVVNVDHKFATRVFNEKMYFWPINNTTLRQNNKLVQNPGW